MVYFRTGLHVGIIPNEQISRYTCISGCQNYSFSNTQDILNILTGSFLENEWDGEPAILRDEERCSGECLTDGEWKNHLLLGASWEHVHSNCACLLRLSLLHWFRFAGFHQCIKIQVKEGRISHEKRQLQEQKRHWRGRIQIEWHVCPADTSLQILHKVQDFMSETEHVPESFPNRIIFTSMFDDITDCVSKKVHGHCLDSAKEVASFAARFKPGCWCFCGPGSDQTWKNNDARPAAQFAHGECDDN